MYAPRTSSIAFKRVTAHYVRKKKVNPTSGPVWEPWESFKSECRNVWRYLWKFGFDVRILCVAKGLQGVTPLSYRCRSRSSFFFQSFPCVQPGAVNYSMSYRPICHRWWISVWHCSSVQSHHRTPKSRWWLLTCWNSQSTELDMLPSVTTLTKDAVSKRSRLVYTKRVSIRKYCSGVRGISIT